MVSGYVRQVLLNSGTFGAKHYSTILTLGFYRAPTLLVYTLMYVRVIFALLMYTIVYIRKILRVGYLIRSENLNIYP